MTTLEEDALARYGLKGKHITLIFCGENGEAGKAVAVSIRNAQNAVVLLNGLMDIDKPMSCGTVIVMPDVPEWRRKNIVAVYGDKVTPRPENPELSMEGVVENIALPLTVKHRGHGQFYVMRGDEIISGPHTKDEALRLAA